VQTYNAAIGHIALSTLTPTVDL